MNHNNSHNLPAIFESAIGIIKIPTCKTNNKHPSILFVSMCAPQVTQKVHIYLIEIGLLSKTADK